MPAPEFKRAYPNNQPLPETGLWFAINQHGLIVAANCDAVRLPNGASHLPGLARPDDAILLGEIGTTACLACAVPDDIALPEGYRAIDLRDLYGRVDDRLYAIASYATQMLHWQRTSNYCANCGAPLAPIPGEWGKRCLRCGFTAYPPVNPCTITLVHDGDRILMTHKAGRGARYGLVAGFVEPGETLEQSVEREVMEETGIEVCDVRYWRSQPWPFPHQLMCGFYARYAGGALRVDNDELDDARWFSIDDLRNGRPALPAPPSIARQLIEHWLAQRAE